MGNSTPDSSEASAVSAKPDKWKRRAIISLVIAVPAAMYSLVQIYDRFYSATGPAFAAHIDFGPFDLPSQLLDDLKEYDREKNKDEFEIALDGKTESERKYGGLQGFVLLTIRNKGTLPANNVRLKVNDDGFARIEWDDGRTQSLQFQNDVPIGTVEIEKSLTLSLWTQSRLSPDTSPLSLIHNTGSHMLRERSRADWSVGASLSSLGIVIGALAYFALQLRKSNAAFEQRMVEQQQWYREVLSSIRHPQPRNDQSPD